MKVPPPKPNFSFPKSNNVDVKLSEASYVY